MVYKFRKNIRRTHLANSYRKVDLWADKIGCSFIEKDLKNENEFLNINTKKDLLFAEKLNTKK